MVYTCSHKSRVVMDKFGKSCENRMFFARDDGFSRLTTYGCIFGTFRSHIWTQRKKLHKIRLLSEDFRNIFSRSTRKIFPRISKISEFFISKSRNVMFSRRNFAQKDDSTYLKLLKRLTFAKNRLFLRVFKGFSRLLV